MTGNDAVRAQLARDLSIAATHIIALLWIVDAHRLGWTLLPEETRALDDARAFVSGPHSAR